ncbi:MAG: flippase-like domain-containing protein [Gemmatimonadota bacterium]|nr:MAG: flippase-like domain-containing protein [Gemmatimonadota bacterium]
MTYRRWLRPLEWAAALAVIFFLGRHVARNWSQIAAYPWSISWPRLVLASVCIAFAYTIFVLMWRRILRLLGGRLSIVDAHRIWYISNLGRYVPGKVWQLAGSAYMARAKDVSPILAVSASLASQLFVLAGGLLVAALTLGGVAERIPRDIRLLGLLAALGLFAVLFTPLFGATYRAALRALGRSDYYTYIRWGERALLLAAYALAWLGFGAGFYLFLSATAESPAASFWPVVGISAAGYVAGFLVLLVPGGIGVREGVYALLLSLYLPGSVAAAVAVLSRVWLTAVELAVAGFLLLRYGLEDLRPAVGLEAASEHERDSGGILD